MFTKEGFRDKGVDFSDNGFHLWVKKFEPYGEPRVHHDFIVNSRLEANACMTSSVTTRPVSLMRAGVSPRYSVTPSPASDLSALADADDGDCGCTDDHTRKSYYEPWVCHGICSHKECEHGREQGCDALLCDRQHVLPAFQPCVFFNLSAQACHWFDRIPCTRRIP